MQKADFQRVFTQNQKSTDNQLVVLARPNGLMYSRLGLAIAKKHAPKAVQRNRIKRLVRESFRLNQPFSIAVDTVVMNRKAVISKSNQQIFQSLTNHWQTINKKLQQVEQQGI